MQKWEYMQLHKWGQGEWIAVQTAEGPANEELYRDIDPKGKIDSIVVSMGASLTGWKISKDMGKTRFLLLLLNKLGQQGWELVGNIDTAGNTAKWALILKRQMLDD